MMQLKKLNTVLFPVRYNDKYYADAIASGEFTKLGSHSLLGGFLGILMFELYVANVHNLMFLVCSDICVGAIACRLEKKEGGAMRVYIMTLGVLAPYRGIGIGSKLLNHVLDMCTKQNMSEIYLHVQTNNDDAIKFYKKFGFDITDTIQDYYVNIEPRDCYVVTKSFAQSEASK
ncbi:hypothetical protein Bca4012_012322 [Brassica carinata]